MNLDGSIKPNRNRSSIRYWRLAWLHNKTPIDITRRLCVCVCVYVWHPICAMSMAFLVSIYHRNMGLLAFAKRPTHAPQYHILQTSLIHLVVDVVETPLAATHFWCCSPLWANFPCGCRLDIVSYFVSKSFIFTFAHATRNCIALNCVGNKLTNILLTCFCQLLLLAIP